MKLVFGGKKVVTRCLQGSGRWLQGGYKVVERVCKVVATLFANITNLQGFLLRAHALQWLQWLKDNTWLQGSNRDALQGTCVLEAMQRLKHSTVASEKCNGF